MLPASPWCWDAVGHATAQLLGLECWGSGVGPGTFPPGSRICHQPGF